LDTLSADSSDARPEKAASAGLQLLHPAPVISAETPRASDAIKLNAPTRIIFISSSSLFLAVL
jgi:hypothetical protein